MTKKPPRDRAKVPETLDPPYYEALGRAIKVIRTEIGMSRKELAEMAGISYPYLADIESGRGHPSSSALLAVAGALGLSPSTLMAKAESFVHRMHGPNAAAEAPIEAPRQSGRWFHDEDRSAAMTTSLQQQARQMNPSSRKELHRLIDQLPNEDLPLALELAQRLLREKPAVE
jgi:transcriptional regulator with XRE-family HTH domain